MTILTIPKQLTKGEELVVIPRSEYDEFSEWRDTARKLPAFREFIPTAAERRDLKRGRAEYGRGKFLTLYELKRKLAASRKGKSV